MKNKWISYQNGNYEVRLCLEGPLSGTKVRQNNENCLIPSRPESLDIQISSYCEQGCEYCYAACDRSGRLADLRAPFFDTLPEWTEIAININNPIPRDELQAFLYRMREKNIIVNATVNQHLFMEEASREYLFALQRLGLLYGLGISLIEPTEELLELISVFENVVIHTIVGIITIDDLLFMRGHNLKILFLGYKTRGRGKEFGEQNTLQIAERTYVLEQEINKLQPHFKVLAFDNLALEQLNMRQHVSQEDFSSSFMGPEGFTSYYIDAVNSTFARSSTDEECWDIGNKTTQEMFEFIQEYYNVIGD